MSDVSVVIPSHNAREYVGPAIESILAQQPPEAVPRQVLVVDDSTDDSPAVVERYVRSTGGLVELLRVPPCTNSAARNAGLERATGKYIAFLDADDLWLAEKTAAQVELLERQGDAVGTCCRLFLFRHGLDDMGRPDWERVRDDPSVADIVLGQMVVASAMLFRREALGDLRFDATTSHAEDTIFAADLRLVGRWRLVDRPLLARRVHGTQITASPWHQVWNTLTRVKWVRRRADRLPAGLASQLEEQFWTGLVSFLEQRYWRRELDGLRAMVAEVAAFDPPALRASFLSRRTILPRWVYRVRDRFAAR